MTYRRLTGTALYLTLFALTGCFIVGCETTERTADLAGQETRKFIGHADPTGVVRFNTKAAEASERIKARIDEIDLESWNQTAACLSEGTRKLNEKIDALPIPELQEALVKLNATTDLLYRKLDTAPLDEAVSRINTLTGQVNERVGEIDVDEINRLLRESSDTMRAVHAQVNLVGPQLNRSLGVLTSQIESTGKQIDALPLEEVRAGTQSLQTSADRIGAATEKLPDSMNALQQALASARTTIRVAAVSLVIISISAVVWLARMIRIWPGRSAKATSDSA